MKKPRKGTCLFLFATIARIIEVEKMYKMAVPLNWGLFLVILGEGINSVRTQDDIPYDKDTPLLPVMNKPHALVNRESYGVFFRYVRQLDTSRHVWT